jgi:hypothetical protein
MKEHQDSKKPESVQSNPVIVENSVFTIQQALKAPLLDPQLKIADALQSLRKLVLEGGLQATPEEEMRALRGWVWKNRR